MRSKKEHIPPEDIADVRSTEDIHNALEWRDMSGIVGKALHHLSEDQLKVFKLSMYGGFSNAIIIATTSYKT